MQAQQTITPVNTLATRLKSSREALGLSQEQVATLAGVSQGTIGNIESGTRHRPREILAIAKAVKVNAEWLLRGVGPRLPASEQPPQNLDHIYDTKLTRAPILDWGELGVSLDKPNSLLVSEPTHEYVSDTDSSSYCKLIKVSDTSLAPRLTPGDLVAIDPSNTYPRRDQVTLFQSTVDDAFFLRRYRPLSNSAFEAYDAHGTSLHSVANALIIRGVAVGVRLSDI